MTISKIRTTAAVAASSLTIVALAACGGGGSVTKGESSSKAAETTSAAPTTARPTEQAEQSSGAAGSSDAAQSDEATEGSSGESSDAPSDSTKAADLNVTIVPAKESDIPGAKKEVERLVSNMLHGKGKEACQQIYSAELGGVPTGAYLDECAKGFTRELGGTDPVAVENELKSMRYSVTSDGMIEVKSPKQGSAMYIVKTSDNRFLMNADKM